MATTSPDAIYSPDTSSVVALATELAAMATSIQTALTNIPTGWGLWAAWTPTASSGFSVVNGALSGRYMQIGKSIRFEVKYVVGSSDTFSGTLNISLPAAPRSGYSSTQPFGIAYMMDSSVGTSSRRTGIAVFAGGTNFFLVAGALTTNATVNSTVPWTWATSDVIYVTGEYEAA